MMTKINSVSLRLATSDDAHLPVYDNTKLQAANTCPTWGILRYAMHKTYSSNSRAMALEAGAAHHEVYAAVRLWQLLNYDCKDLQHRYDLFNYHGVRLFGKARFSEMVETQSETEDQRTNCLNFCLQALYNSGFYDDPSDNRRTMSNLEEAAIMYIDRWNFNKHPIWIRDRDDPHSDVGIEIAFDVVITFDTDSGKRQYRFAGKLDGLHENPGKGSIFVGENKTAARMDEAWRMSFEMSSQVTGYMLAASVFTGQPIDAGIVYGVQIPLPRNYDISGLVTEPVSRKPFMFARWFGWFLHTVSLYEAHENDPIGAPKYTHSCNRYFRPCAFIPFCTSDDEEQQRHIDEMDTEEWSPLHDKGANSGD